MATALFDLQATSRTDLGKGASRRLRRLKDLVPGIIYGASKKPQAISLEQRVLRKALETESFYSQILSVTLEGQTEKVILKDMQRHPYKPLIQHIDFQRVDMNTPLHMHVPIHFINEATSPGVQAGGRVSHQMSELAISCLPSDLPEFIEIDLANIELDQILHISDLKLPKGVSSTALAHGSDNDAPVLSIHLPRVSADETQEAAEAAAAEAAIPAKADAKKDSDTKKDKK